MYKVLVFGITENPGGVEAFLVNYYRKIDRTKIQFDFLCNTHNKVAYENELKSLGGQVIHIAMRSKEPIKYRQELKQFMEQHASEYQAVWVNVCSLGNIDYLKVAKKYGIQKRIIHSHNSQNMDNRIRKILHMINRRKIDQYATDFWACSQLAARFMFPKNVVKKEQYCFIPNGINLEKFQFNISTRREKRKELHLENTFVIGNIGRLCYQKNQRFLLNVFSDVYQNMPESRLLLVGDGDDRKELELYAESLGLLDSVIIYGTSNHVEELLCAMDVFAFPSLFEGLGIAMIEAQASGLPVICSDQIPKESVVSDDVYRISVHDRDGWVKALLRMDGGRQKCLLENELLSNYDIRRLSRQMEKIYCRKRKNG